MLIFYVYGKKLFVGTELGKNILQTSFCGTDKYPSYNITICNFVVPKRSVW